MCALEGRDIRRSTLLIVGATGDVGSGCARCLAPFVKRVMLYARNAERLRILAAELEADGTEVEIATGLEQFPYAADIVICAASLASPSLRLGRIAPEAIICDAGYPKNLIPATIYPAPESSSAVWDRSRGRIEFHARFQRSSESASIPGCGPWMST